MSMNTLQMEIAIMQYLKPMVNTIVTCTGGGQYIHECDVLSVTPSGYATEVEIKISRSDLLADSKKQHGHDSNWIKYLYFAVPENLKDVALKAIPDRAGLIVVTKTGYGHYCIVVKSAEINVLAKKWNESQISNLQRIGNLRVLGLKKKILALK